MASLFKERLDEAEADESLTLRPDWFTEQVPEQLGQHREKIRILLLKIYILAKKRLLTSSQRNWNGFVLTKNYTNQQSYITVVCQQWRWTITYDKKKNIYIVAYWVKKRSSLNRLHWDESMELTLWNGSHFTRPFSNIDPCLFGPIAFIVCLSCVLHACIMHKIEQFWNLTRIHYRKIQYRISVCYLKTVLQVFWEVQLGTA